MRIAKFMAESGVGSRRNCEKFIEEGRVKVNGLPITSPALEVSDDDEILFNGRKIVREIGIKTIAFYKPLNCIVSSNDPSGRHTIFDILPRKYRNFKYIGRLDFKTEGLLLLTNSGDLARALTLPESDISRVYIAKVSGFKNESQLDAARKGITIDGINYRPMKISIISTSNSRAELKIEIIEGKNREVRRVMEACGLWVYALKRVQYGSVKLGNMKPGEIRLVETLDTEFTKL